MKLRINKRLLLILSLCLFFSLNSVMAAESSQKVRYFGEDNADQLIELSNNEIAVIELDANYSTGYSWNFEALDSDTIKLLGKKYVYDSQTLGANGKEQLYFQGVSQGQTEVILHYMQPSTRNIENVVSYQIYATGNYTGNFRFEIEDNVPVVEDGGQSASLPAKFNWCDQGGCTSIKSQGSCGSCWAFATVGVFESVLKIKDKKNYDLSEQYLVSCNSDNWGCNGGWFAHDYHVNKTVPGENEAGGVKESVFPYQGINGSCNSPYAKVKKLKSWAYVGSQNSVPSTSAIKQAIHANGPVAVAVCANTEMQNYSGGVFSGPSCSKVNHAVILTGWDDGLGVWYMRNSWGTGWGESGNMRIKYGVCAIGHSANYVSYGGDPNPGQLTLNVSIEGKGSVRLDPPGGKYDRGTRVTLRATANAGESFKNWSGDLSGSNSTATLTMNTDKNVTAIFTGGVSQSTCKGHCGGKSADGSCWCDNYCEQYGDCCADKKQFCGF